MTHSRVRLEQLTFDHEADLAVASAADGLCEAWVTNIPSPSGMRNEIERRLGLQERGVMAPFAIIEPESNTAVGMTTYMNIDAANHRVEIGSTWIATRVQRTGLNPAAKLLLLTRAFEELDCIAVEFRTHVRNDQSRAAISKLGATQDGVLRNHMILPNGTLRDTVCFSIIDSEWPDVKRRLETRVGA